MKHLRYKTIFLYLLLIVGLLLVVSGFSYAYFISSASSDNQTVESGTLQLTYLTDRNILLADVFPTDESEAGIHTFAIENTGTLEATYYLYLTDIMLQKDGVDTQSNNLKWKLYKATSDYTEAEEISSGTFEEGNNPIELDTVIQINPAEKQYYILKIWLQEIGVLQNWDQGLVFSGKVEATTVPKTINRTLVSMIKKDAVMDNVASTYVTSSTGIDFSQISSDTNGKGLYILHDSVNSQFPIMYYRGAVENNHVKFASLCWKIVRTTETGGVKLLYNGKPNSNGECNTTGEATLITNNQPFNTEADDNAYLGYMYGETGSDSYDETHRNDHASTIKSIIEEWYSQNMMSYTDDLEDTVWCNDRGITLASSSIGPGTGTSATAYMSRYRLVDNQNPSFECKNVNDRFTVSEDNGNGALTYLIALLTADEVAYAGGVYHTANNSYYLNNDLGWWLLSPSYFNGSKALVFQVYAEGYLNDYTVDFSYGIRPAVSLKAGTRIISGGNGTRENPYVVE